MFVKILGILDLFCVGCIVLLSYSFKLPLYPVVAFAMYLIFKGVIFWGDITSFFDMISGVYLILLFIGFSSTFLSVVFGLYLFQKAAFSLG